ncbi:cytochrome P450 11B, mitochondrial-like, partial [Rhincodon typus]|uniref:cytochrome P450 11B, mitochondrial-like n=1 Tax=Rhincodon typus TaxID=259920 RepID=UPI00202EAB1B
MFLPKANGQPSGCWSRSVSAGAPPNSREHRGAQPYEAIPLAGDHGWLNLYHLWRTDGFFNRHQVMTENFNRLGPIYREKLGSKESVNIFQPDDIAVLFQSEGMFPKRMLLDAWVAHRDYRNHKCGIFLKNGEVWRSERLVLNKEVISPSAVGKFSPLVDLVVREFTDFVERELEAGRWHTEFNMLPILFRLSLESSFHLLYGDRLGLFAEKVDSSSDRFIQAVEEMLQTTILLLYIPLELAKWLNVKPWRDHMAAWDFLFEHADQCFGQLMHKLQNVPEGERKYLGIIPELIHQSKLPVDIIKANSVELMVGSVETVSISARR